MKTSQQRQTSEGPDADVFLLVTDMDEEGNFKEPPSDTPTSTASKETMASPMDHSGAHEGSYREGPAAVSSPKGRWTTCGCFLQCTPFPQTLFKLGSGIPKSFWVSGSLGVLGLALVTTGLYTMVTHGFSFITPKLLSGALGILIGAFDMLVSVVIARGARPRDIPDKEGVSATITGTKNNESNTDHGAAGNRTQDPYCDALPDEESGSDTGVQPLLQLPPVRYANFDADVFTRIHQRCTQWLVLCVLCSSMPLYYGFFNIGFLLTAHILPILFICPSAPQSSICSRERCV